MRAYLGRLEGKIQGKLGGGFKADSFVKPPSARSGGRRAFTASYLTATYFHFVCMYMKHHSVTNIKLRKRGLLSHLPFFFPCTLSIYFVKVVLFSSLVRICLPEQPRNRDVFKQQKAARAKIRLC